MQDPYPATFQRRHHNISLGAVFFCLHVNNNLSNVKQSITQLNGYKVSFYGIFDKTLEELYNLSKTNTACYIGFIDWRQSEITISNGTIIWFACNWVVFAISGSGLYVLDGSTMAWKKTS